MGMFDNIEYRGRQYQTKDTPLQTLDNYKIEQDQDSGHWRLWHEEYDSEWVDSDENALFGGTFHQSNHRWVCCDDFDGLIRFYYYRSNEDQEEYEALFMDGQMLKIRQTLGEPLTEWLVAGIKDRGLE
jgi:hypothetical protein